jgi:DNA-binding response OmpR family regulator
MNASVLVVDADAGTRELVATILERAGHEVSVAADGQGALRLLFELRPQLVVLDLSMPGLDGWDVLQWVRDLSDVPVLVLTGRDEELMKVRALRGGADDYLTKPYGHQELMARVDALLRRTGRAPGDDAASAVYEDRNLTLDFVQGTAQAGERDLALTPLEFRLLTAFVRNAGRVVSADILFEAAWGGESVGGRDRVKLYVGYLRRKLADAGVESAIETVRGFGYRYRPPARGD